MGAPFKFADFERSRWPTIMRMGVIQSVEGFNKKTGRIQDGSGVGGSCIHLLPRPNWNHK